MFLRSIVSLYSWNIAAGLVTQLADKRYSGARLFYWFWHTKSYRPQRALTDAERSMAVLIVLLMLGQIGIGIAFVVDWVRFGTPGMWEFGAAILLSYPLVWAHVLAFLASLWHLLYYAVHPKQFGRVVVCTILEAQVRQLRKRHSFTVVAVAGSIGKTSTKLAIAELLGQGLRVRHQAGNYNDRVTVPLVFFGLSEPSLFNVLAWIKVFGAARSEIALPYQYDIVVVELGTDGPGQLADFAYIRPDITVVTAVAPEHMELFGDLDHVATEELSVFGYSRQVLVNGDDIAGEYLAGRQFLEYSLVSSKADYYGAVRSKGLHGQKLTIAAGKHTLHADIRFLGKQGAKFALAAAAVADIVGLKPKQIEAGLPELKPFAGRMQVLPGINDTTLIDDTYNSSPVAAKAALDVLYAAKTTQRIAILGSMNELGAYSRQAHQEVGGYCDASKLDMVITIGKDAQKWLASAAKEKGCTVHSFMSPYDAGSYVADKVHKGAVVLAKGSQNGVFAEESLKALLVNPDDSEKLVRQSQYWLDRKAKQFR